LEDRVLKGRESAAYGQTIEVSPEFRQRSVRMAGESERPIAAVARDLGIHHETLRREVRDLRRANEILKATSVLFARDLEQPRPR